MTDSLVKKAGKGVAWNLLSQIVQQAVQFVVIIILARKLTPGDFGIFSMALIFAGLLEPLRQWGFQAFLIQKKDITQEYEDTAFWSICFIGICLFVISITCAPLVGHFFSNPRVSSIFAVIALGFLLSPIGAIQWALITRDLNFKAIAIRGILVTFIYASCVCVLAVKGFGVWALVFAALCRELAWSVIFWLTSDWRPRLQFSADKLKEMLGFSLNSIGSGVLKYIINNIDNLTVGKFLGAANLGFYNMAFNTVSHPQAKLVTHISTVSFPAFSSMKDDMDRFKETYFKIISIVLLVITPILAILFTSAKNFVMIFYGGKWLPAVLPIQIMCLYGFVKALTSISGSVFLSNGRADLDLKMNVFKLTVFILSLTFGLRYGIVGVSIAVLVYSIIIFSPEFYFANKLLKVTALRFYSIVARYLALFFLISGVILIVGFYLKDHAMAPLFQLILNMLICFLVYAAALIVFFKSDLENAIRLFRKVIA